MGCCGSRPPPTFKYSPELPQAPVFQNQGNNVPPSTGRGVDAPLLSVLGGKTFGGLINQTNQMVKQASRETRQIEREAENRFQVPTVFQSRPQAQPEQEALPTATPV